MGDHQNTKRIFNKYADGYEAKYMNVSLYHNSLDLFCGNLKDNARVLEIGCGPGNITRYLLSKRPDLKLLGTDIAENMIALAAKNNPETEFKVMDCRKIGQMDQKFDGVVGAFCLPYLSKEEALKLIDDISGMLNPGGVFYLSTMEDSYEKSGYEGSDSDEDKLYINYHESGYLKEALEQNNLELLKSFMLKNPANKPGVEDLILVARKQL